MIEKIVENTLWEHLKTTKKPIFIYGFGVGALKIKKAMDIYGIPLSGMLVSDCVRSLKSFLGFEGIRVSKAIEANPDIIILMGFAVNAEPMMSLIYNLNQRVELYSPDVPVSYEEETFSPFTKDYFVENYSRFLKLYNNLADDHSREVFINIINFKISGKIDYLTPNFTDPIQDYSLFGFGDNESFLDLGAYNGDTIDQFLTVVNSKYKKIIAVEPDKKNYNKLVKKINDLNLSDVITYNNGIWDTETELSFDNTNGGRSCSIKQVGEESILVKTIDGIVDNGDVSYIKFDVEGAEMQALIGGKDTITRCRPKILMSAYHKNDDLITLSEYLLSLNNDYKVFLRQHQYIPAWETNLYFV